MKKVHEVTKFNQNTWLKSYTDMNTDLRRKEKNVFEIDCFKLINNAVFEKNHGNCKKPWKMWDNIEILNLSQQKEEGII